jgi:AraC family transcriptional regulator
MEISASRTSASSSFPTFEEWLAKPFNQPLTSSETLGWSDVDLYTSRLNASREYVEGPSSDQNTLVLTLDGATRLEALCDGKLYDERLTAGAIIMVPAQHGSVGRWSLPVTGAFVQLSPRLLTPLADSTIRGDPAHVQLLPGVNIQDTLLSNLILALYNELQNLDPLGTLFVESVSHTIMLHLLRKYSNAIVKPQAPRGRLTPAQVRTIDEYVDNHLDQKISLTDLAHLLHISVSHFERMFRATFNCAPYHYVLERRLDRARLLLLYNSDLSIYEIARRCGFANQSHFTKHFSRQVGVSPTRFASRSKQ